MEFWKFENPPTGCNLDFFEGKKNPQLRDGKIPSRSWDWIKNANSEAKPTRCSTQIFNHPTIKAPQLRCENSGLVGGWTNPIEKYWVQLGSSSPKVRGEHKKSVETIPLWKKCSPPFFSPKCTWCFILGFQPPGALASSYSSKLLVKPFRFKDFLDCLEVVRIADLVGVGGKLGPVGLPQVA